MASSNTNGVSLSYGYDNVGRLSTVTDSRLSGSNTTTYTYDAASNLATSTYPNGVEAQFTYDHLNRILDVSSQISGYTYQLGPVGNRTAVAELSGRAVTWTYDGINRLTNETIATAPGSVNGSVGYGLDPVGNRQSIASTLSGVSSGSATFNADDEMAAESYDSDGNTVSVTGKTFTYDSENRLTGMNSGAVTLLYDGDGNRVSKTVGGVTTKYLVDDINPTGLPQVVDELVSGAVTRFVLSPVPRCEGPVAPSGGGGFEPIRPAPPALTIPHLCSISLVGIP